MATARPELAASERGRRGRLHSALRPLEGPRWPWLAAWAPVFALALLAALDALGVGSQLALLALVSGLLLLSVTIAAGLSELREADARARAALARAEAAEASERARAEELQLQLSETRRMQEQLIQASKLAAVGELAAAVAHEVNNPLTGILGFAELLMSEVPEDDPCREEVAVIQTEAMRARGIVRALLEFARPRPPQRIPTDINAMIRSAVDLVRFRAQESGVELIEDYGKLPELEVDPDALTQVLLNMFSNAFDAMPMGGELRVASKETGGRVGIVVSDNGVGMDAATKSRIFTPFFTTRAGAEGGTGLGLSVSLRAVEVHGGSIEVDSQSGRGSIFTIWLPAVSSPFDGPVVVPGAGVGHVPRRPGKGAAP